MRYEVYDLEWRTDTYEIRLAGLYDGNIYRAFKSVRALLNAMLDPEKDGTVFFAHFGGSSDVLFLIHEIMHSSRHYEVEACFTGSAASIVRITRGERTWILADSSFLMRTALRNIGKFVGIEKGNADQSEAFYNDSSFEELRDYNEIDCQILFRGIEGVEKQLTALGGEMRLTIASCAMRLFRRRYLKLILATDPKVNAAAIQAYTASRVEVFKEWLSNGYDYDINSAFPFAMLRPMPGRLQRASRRLDDHSLCLAKVTVKVDDTYLPHLPYRNEKGSIYFPHGTWTSWYIGADLDLLRRSKNHRILKVHDVYYFEPFFALRDFAQELYSLRQGAPAGSFESEVWKILLNGLYGKFAERQDREKILINPKNTTCRHSPKCPPDQSCMRMLMPGIVAVSDERHISHRHVAISAAVTAGCRQDLGSRMQGVVDQSKSLAYCDTDGFVSDAILPTSDALGGLKIKREVVNGHFSAPKVYALEHSDKSFTVHAKGFPRIGVTEYMSIANSEALHSRRMARFKELCAIGRRIGEDFPHPRDIPVHKAMRYNVHPKRLFLPDRSDSEPWHVDNIPNQAIPWEDQ